jgi:hypothetical protein
MNKKTKKDLTVVALLVGSNALTATFMAVMAADLLRRQQESALQIMKNVKMYQKALDRFAREAPVSVAIPILDELNFDWTVRDLA